MNVDTPAALAALFAARPEESGLFTDFDGTLAPIVADPAAAAPLPGTTEALGEMAGRLAKVAVVSGRPVSFLARRLGPAAAKGVELYGLHGLERWDGKGPSPVREAAAWAGPVSEARTEAESEAVPGLEVEDKTYSVTLHWRRALDPATVGAAAGPLARRLARAHGLVARPGKASVELVPPLSIDKGTVVAALGSGLGLAAFIGDDLGDVRAFEALSSLARDGTAIARVAVTGPEAPPALLAAADLVLSGPEETAALLTQIVRRLSSR